MERFDYEDRQRNRYQPGSDRFNNSDRFNRFGSDDDEQRYGRDDDFDRSSRSTRYGRDYDSSNRPWSSSSGFGSSGYERYGHSSSSDRYGSSSDRHSGSSDRYGSGSDRYSGGSDRYEYRPQHDYRSMRDDSRYDTRGSSQRFNEYDQSFDPNLGGRNQSRRNDWDYERPSSYQGSNYGSGSYGQSYGSNRDMYGSQRSGFSGRSGQGSGYGSSQNRDYYSQGYGSSSSGQGYSSSMDYGSQQYGQHGNGSQSQRWGSESSMQSKAGKGPKGYRRSDERIKEEISDMLTSHPEVDPSEVEIKVSTGEVTLTGTVNSRHEKRLIEDLASQVSGVSDVTNQLRVQQQQDSSRSSSSSGDGQHKSGQSTGSTSQSSGSQSFGSQQSSKSIQ